MSVFEGAIVAFIILSILYHVWRGGSRNPQSTGQLGFQVNGLATKVTALSGRVDSVQAKLEELEREAATTKDINVLDQKIEGKIETVRAEMKGHRDLSDATNRSVGRIEKMLIERGLGK